MNNRAEALSAPVESGATPSEERRAHQLGDAQAWVHAPQPVDLSLDATLQLVELFNRPARVIPGLLEAIRRSRR